MLEFLGLLLALVLALSPNGEAYVAPEDIIARIEAKIGQVEASQGKALEHAGQGLAALGESEESSSLSAETPDTEKSLTYNSESERQIGEVPQVAVDNAPPLEPCTEELCPSPTPTPINPPSFIGPPVPLPDPEPIPGPIPPNPDPCLPPVPNHPGVLLPDILFCI